MDATIDVRIEDKGTHVAVHNFKVSNAFSHISKVNKTFDYISLSAKVSERDFVGLFLSLDLANDLISRLTIARDSLISERAKADSESAVEADRLRTLYTQRKEQS
jgi:hypothetical protein